MEDLTIMQCACQGCEVCLKAVKLSHTRDWDKRLIHVLLPADMRHGVNAVKADAQWKLVLQSAPKPFFITTQDDLSIAQCADLGCADCRHRVLEYGAHRWSRTLLYLSRTECDRHRYRTPRREDVLPTWAI